MTPDCSSARAVTAFVASWEYQCCGDPFAVGDRVELDLFPVASEPHAWPDVPGGPVRWYAGHHGPEAPEVTLSGRVVGLWEAFMMLELRGGRHYLTVPGTERTRPVDRIVPFDRGRPDFPELADAAKTEHFQGWLVRLAAELTAEPGSPPGAR